MSRYLLVVADGVPVCVSVGRHLLAAGDLGAAQEALHLLRGQRGVTDIERGGGEGGEERRGEEGRGERREDYGLGLDQGVQIR